MSILKWNNQDKWNSYITATNIDTSEHPNYLRKLYLSDEFNNAELSLLRWTETTKTNITTTETTYLNIVGAGTSNYELTQNYALPSIFTINFDFSSLAENTSLTFKFTSTDGITTYTSRIVITQSSVVFYKNGVLTSTTVISSTGGTLRVEKYDSTTYGIYYVASNLTNVIYTGTISFLSNPIVSILLSSTYTGILCNFTNLEIEGYSEPDGFMFARSIYKFIANGRPKSIYLDATNSIDEVIYLQVSPDGNLDILDTGIRWYGANGEDSIFINAENTIPNDMPISTTNEYYYQVCMSGISYEAPESHIAYSTYVYLEDAVKSNVAFSDFLEMVSPNELHVAYADYILTYQNLDVHLGYSNLSIESIYHLITKTDTFFTFRNIILTNAEELWARYIPTVDMSGLAIYGDFTGTIAIETADGTFYLPNNTLTLISTTSGNYVKIIASGQCNINYIGVAGIWL